MGDRALVVFKSETGMLSPAIYLHWGGSRVVELLQMAAPRMRSGDVSYAAARFVGTCHEAIPGGLSLGIFNVISLHEAADMAENNGLFVVDVDTGAVVNDGTPVGTVPLGRF